MPSSREAEHTTRADAAVPPVASAPDDAQLAQQRIEELEGEVAALDDRYRRAVADLDNLRKRSAREVDRRVDQEREALLRDWLQALDTVERALRQPGAAENPLLPGLHALLGQMESILDRQGVQRIGSAGERFDPNRHHAVAVREIDQVPDRTVMEVARSGFALGDRVLRPAEVVVARHPEGTP
ncbi:MAG TPA: nucleotide exchange factor GrpE [Solirubrobacteraceae bacterium]|nr:nucleotide exchange factor GrpE [Solirubrobacteraceae bacterium]